MKRRRSKNSFIANAGKDLFNGVYYDLNDDCFQQNKGIKSFIYNLFTTDYDDLLERNNLHLKRSSYALLAELKNKDIPEYVNNSIYNIILDIIYHKEGMRKKKEMKRMFHYYYDLVKLAYKNNDHNTTLIIKCALDHIVIKQLKFKILKSEQKLLNKFKEEYGQFIDCYKNHVKNIMKNKDNLKEFIPSAMVLDMHLKKNNMYTKAFKSIGKYPENLINHQFELNNISRRIKEYYTNMPNAIINLYTENPFDHSFVYATNNNQMIGDLLDATRNIR
tara:strand:+ start:2148 stop:2975 length:828 start_codon:yes stop_codon:yes gene_type:complete